MRNYTELSSLETFEDRFNYLRLDGTVGTDTFGFDRYLNQRFYNMKQNPKWKKARNEAILRDNGCELGCLDRPIQGKILVHHMNPITKEDILNQNEDVYNPEYLVCVSHQIHNAIHYGNENLIPKGPVKRTPNDTCPWKNA